MMKNGLVLSGGGSRGGYEIGVWQALKELGIKIDVVTGTSVGALNAALVAMDDIEAAVDLWHDIETSMVFDVNLDESKPLNKKITLMLQQFIRDYALRGGTDAYPLKMLLDDCIDEEKVRKSQTKLGIVTFNKSDLTPLRLLIDDIAPGELTEYLIASSSLFPAIKSYKIDGKEYIDGGYCDNLPIELAAQCGAENIIAVDLNAVGIVRKADFKLAKKLKIIKSYWDLGALLVFDADTIRRVMRLGYLDAMKAFSVYDGVAYSFIKGQIPSFIKKNGALIAAQNEALKLTFKRLIPRESSLSPRETSVSPRESDLSPRETSVSPRESDLSPRESDLSPREKVFAANIQTMLRRKFGKDFEFNYRSFFTACMEIAAESFKLSPQILYGVDLFSRTLLDAVNAAEIQDDKPASSRALKKTLSLLSPQGRAIYLGKLIKKSAAEHKSFSALDFGFLVPEDIMAAYYIALIS